jgi:hypothetical protein
MVVSVDYKASLSGSQTACFVIRTGAGDEGPAVSADCGLAIISSSNRRISFFCALDKVFSVSLLGISICAKMRQRDAILYSHPLKVWF